MSMTDFVELLPQTSQVTGCSDLLMGDPMVVSQSGYGSEHSATVITSPAPAQAPSHTWVIWTTPCRPYHHLNMLI